ncbi:carboxylesterase/lipase family protein [Phenylobacterium sp.]|uniref:carboxylesterase/lipase family protein n=1 Tax=Phenylobacterium sp. TaxID=1871053 RepID=UPI0027349CB5|nr:carboxylesterase/lipase family protein [Phenylobacterium sp.]MDP3659500.1 carboxylesterase/lipase family protein [Phenylobacterium sp.]
MTKGFEHGQFTMDRRRMLALGLAASFAPLAARAQTLTAPVATGFGPVRGIAGEGYSAFLGLRYAAPPTGALRFMPPAPPVPWKEPVSATAYGAPPVQMYARPSGEASSALGRSLYPVFPHARETREGREDCLFLNVWTPAPDAKKRPVMVWLHGGGHVYGSGSWPSYDGTNLARRHDVVVVTLNHRLNAFGYLNLASAMGETYAKSASVGLLDIVSALEWVRANIEAFGGDPSNVTLFGESGGGGKVSALMAIPAAKGLFHKAMVQSGAGLRAIPADKAAESAALVLTELRVAKGDTAALNALPAAQIITACYAVQARTPGSLSFGPVLDGVVLPRNPFDPDAPAQSADIPLVIGTNKDEMTLFLASSPWFGTLTEAQLVERADQIAGARAPALLAALREARPGYSPTYLLAALMSETAMVADSYREADRKAAQAAPVFMYRLDWETPIADGVFKTPHTLDIPLAFDNIETARVFVGPGPEPQILADQMSAAWAAFARNGDPSTPKLPWPRYDPVRRATAVFNVESRIVRDPDPKVRAALMA